MGRLLAKLEPLWCWLDGNDNTDALHAMALQVMPRRRAAEEFLVQVMRSSDVRDRSRHAPRGFYTTGLSDLYPTRVYHLAEQGVRQRMARR